MNPKDTSPQAEETGLESRIILTIAPLIENDITAGKMREVAKDAMQLISDHTAKAVEQKLVLFGAELAYCLANKFPIGEGHTPPSYLYEAMEAKATKWLQQHNPKTHKNSVSQNDIHKKGLVIVEDPSESGEITLTYRAK